MQEVRNKLEVHEGRRMKKKKKEREDSYTRQTITPYQSFSPWS